MTRSAVISRAARSTALASGFVRNGADLIVRKSDLAADPDMMRKSPGRARQVADLQDRQLAQSWVEPAAVADEPCESVEAAGSARAVREEAVEIEVPRQKILMFGEQIGFVEI